MSSKAKGTRVQGINSERQQRLQGYVHARRRLLLWFSLPLLCAYALILFITPELSLLGIWNTGVRGFFAPLGWQPLSGWFPLRILAYYLLLMYAVELVYIPLWLYMAYGLKRRWRIATMPFMRYVRTIVRAQSWLVLKWSVFILLLYLLCNMLQAWWWLGMGIIHLAYAIAVERYKPALLARQLVFSPLLDPTLKQRLLNLMERCAADVEGIYIVEKRGTRIAPNAFVLGWGRTRRIGVTRTLIERFNIDEIEVIIAHEIAHHIHHDIWKRILCKGVLTTLGYACIALLLYVLAVIPSHAFMSSVDISTLPYVLGSLVFSWLAKSIGYNALSRRLEFEADEYALRITGLAQAFRDVMVKLANTNEVLAQPGGHMFSSHPTIASRIEHAEHFQNATSFVTSPPTTHL